MREDICYRYTFCPMCPLSVHICVQQITHLVDSAQFPPLMQNREEDWPRSGPAQLRKARLTHPTWESAPTQLEAVTWDWPRGSDQLPSDHPVEAIVEAIGEAIAHWPASGLRLLARDVGYLIWGVSVFTQSGFHLIQSRRKVKLDKTSQIIFSNLNFSEFFLLQIHDKFHDQNFTPLKEKVRTGFLSECQNFEPPKKFVLNLVQREDIKFKVGLKRT